MNRIAAAARLEAVLYLKTCRVVMPGLAWLAYLVTFYAIGPVDPVSSSALTALALALVMAWAGLSFARAQELVVSQLLQLKLGSPMRECAVHALLLLGSSAAVTLLSAAWPLIKYAASRGTFFVRAVTAADILAMGGLFFSASVMGGAFGALFYPRIFKDTRAAWLLALAGCLLGTFSGVIAQRIPVFAFAAPLLPPLYGIITRLGSFPVFEPAALTGIIAECWAYTAAAFALKSLLLRRIRY